MRARLRVGGGVCPRTIGALLHECAARLHRAPVAATSSSGRTVTRTAGLHEAGPVLESLEAYGPTGAAGIDEFGA